MKDETKTFELCLLGDMPSKKNAWARSGSRVYLRGDVSGAIDNLVIQVRVAWNRLHNSPISAPVTLDATFVVRRDKDLDNMVTTLCDVLQTAGVLKDDKQIMDITARKIKRETGDDAKTLVAIGYEAC